MIRAVVIKEFTQYYRDRRLLGLVTLLLCLMVVSLVTGWSAQVSQRRQAIKAQQGDQTVFQSQGEKTPHAAAHFGRMAYKKMPPLAVFDPGAAPYLGQVIWLEAHTRAPAMFRAIEDTPALGRLADLSVAGMLTLVLPLLAFLLGYGSFAAERERGTLRLLASTGIRLHRIFFGKFLAIAVVVGGTALVALFVSVLLAMASPGEKWRMDILMRGSGLMFGYGVYGLVCTAFALWVSARMRTAGAALMLLLSIWILSAVLIPKMAASVAEQIHPTPDGATFWREAASAIRSQRPDRQSKAYRDLQVQVVSDAVGYAVTADELAEFKLNRPGLMFEIGERIGAKAYEQAYTELFETYANQRRLRRVFALLSPTIALQHGSQAMAGTDVTAHAHFADAAEKQRQVMVRKMNEEMMLKGAGQSFYYLASEDFWSTIPDFSYVPPDAATSMKVALWDFLMLLAWLGLAYGLAGRASRRLKMI